MRLKLSSFLVSLSLPFLAFGSTYSISAQTQMIGDVKQVSGGYNESLASIAEDYDIGYYELLDANPQINPSNLSGGIIIPSRFILPPGPHEGIVINLAEFRLYYYDASGTSVTTFPIGIGTAVAPTPVGSARIVAKVKNPSWHVPTSIQAEYRARGETVPTVVPPGPENPLGDHALRLSIPGYLLHGTNNPSGIGRRITHGCIRLYPKDVAHLYETVPVNTPVRIIHAPVKMAWVNGKLYVEMHKPLPNYPSNAQDLTNTLMDLLYQQGPAEGIDIDWSMVKALAQDTDGIPTAVGKMQ